MKQETKEKIKELVEDDQPLEACKLFQKHLGILKWNKKIQVVLLIARIKRLDDQHLNDTIALDDYNIFKNRINHSILKLLDSRISGLLMFASTFLLLLSFAALCLLATSFFVQSKGIQFSEPQAVGPYLKYEINKLEDSFNSYSFLFKLSGEDAANNNIEGMFLSKGEDTPVNETTYTLMEPNEQEMEVIFPGSGTYYLNLLFSNDVTTLNTDAYSHMPIIKSLDDPSRSFKFNYHLINHLANNAIRVVVMIFIIIPILLIFLLNKLR